MLSKLSLSALLLLGVTLSAHSATFPLDTGYQGENLSFNKVWVANGQICAMAAGACSNGKTYDDKRGVVTPGKTCIFSCAVKYFTAAEREQIKLTWDDKAKVWLGSDKKPFDSEKAARAKGVTVADLDTNGRNLASKDNDKWGLIPALWVLDPAGNLYVSVEQKTGKLHHSSILAGGPVAAAGLIAIDNGKIVHINNQSGHYKPTDDGLVNVLGILHVPPGSPVVQYCQSGNCKNTPTAGAKVMTPPEIYN